MGAVMAPSLRADEIASENPRALFTRRLFAGSIDLLLAGGLGLVAVAVLPDALLRERPTVGGIVAIVGALIYYWLLEGIWGVTAGKALFRLRVVTKSGAPPGLARSAVRTVLRLVEVNPLLLGGIPAAIVAARSKGGRRLGDLLAGTVVLDAGDVTRVRITGEATHPPDEGMAGLRAMMLRITPEEGGFEVPPSPHGVWGSVTDISTGGLTATVVFLADGTSSLYLSNGGGILGGESHESVRIAGAQLLRSLEGALASLHPGAAGRLPPPGGVRFYVHARDGLFVSEEVDSQALAQGGHPLSSSFADVNEVFAALREARPEGA